MQTVRSDGATKTDYQDVRNLAIKSAIRQINSNLAEIRELDILIENFLDNFDYKLTSMKGIDVVMAANLIAEIGDIDRFETSAKLACYSGIAPVTYASGKTELQFSNERGNRELKAIFFQLSALVIMTPGKDKRIVNPFFYEYYHRKISEGKTKKQGASVMDLK